MQKYRVVGVRADGSREVRAVNISAGIVETLQAGDLDADFFIRVLIERDDSALTTVDRSSVGWSEPEF